MAILSFRATRRFVQSYDHAQPLRKACVIGALSDLRRAYDSDPKLFLRRYPAVSGLRGKVREMDISGGERLLFHHRDGTVHLLEVGDHEIVPHYKQTAALGAELSKTRPLPPGIARLTTSGFFTFDVEKKWKRFANEADPDWLTYLDRPQAAAVRSVLRRMAETASHPRAWSFTVLIGGPGTGKTSILLNLFCRALEIDVIPQIVVEDQVAEFVEASGIKLDACRVALHQADALSEGGILLVDDPQTVNQILRAKALAQLRRFRAVVVAVDPLQMRTAPTDEEFRPVLSGTGVMANHLRVCYRQKEIVGQAAKTALDAIARSSPFYAEYRKDDYATAREHTTRIANDLTFTNPSGRAKVYAPATLDDVKAEVRRLRRAPALWRHASPYLIAHDDEHLSAVPLEWRKCLQELPRATYIEMRRSLEIKGIEFQHVILILSRSLFLGLENGFEGVSQPVYHQRRLYRIPLTRAKDSITVLVVP